jgi:hypothetical protein
MAAFSKKAEITLPATPEEGAKWGWEPHETVTIKGNFTMGDAQSSVKMTTDDSPDEVNTLKLMEAMIVSWNFTDDNHNVVVLSPQSVAQLPLEYAGPIIQAIGKITGKGAIKDPLASSKPSPAPTKES